MDTLPGDATPNGLAPLPDPLDSPSVLALDGGALGPTGSLGPTWSASHKRGGLNADRVVRIWADHGHDPAACPQSAAAITSSVWGRGRGPGQSPWQRAAEKASS
jgi:hypothetical protein